MRYLSFIICFVCLKVYGASEDLCVDVKSPVEESLFTTVNTVDGRKFWEGEKVAISLFDIADRHQYIAMMVKDGYKSDFTENLTVSNVLAMANMFEHIKKEAVRSYSAEMDNAIAGLYSIFSKSKDQFLGYLVVKHGCLATLKLDLVTKTLVMDGTPEYSEMFLTIDPEFRGKGFGTDVRKVLYNRIVTDSLVGKPTLGIHFCESGPVLQRIPGFRGVKSIVNISNTASLRSLFKANATLMAIFNADDGTEIAQFVYPPSAEAAVAARSITARHVELLREGSKDALDTIRKEFGLTAK